MFEAAAGSRKADSAVGSPAAEFFCFLAVPLITFSVNAQPICGGSDNDRNDYRSVQVIDAVMFFERTCCLA